MTKPRSTPVDLRSDTVTIPPPEMRRAMARAEVGDDVLDGDPSVRRLEARVAERLGYEAAVFFPTGTQANQTGIALHSRPGTEGIVESRAHLLDYEKAGAAQFWGVQLVPVSAPAGRLTPDLVDPAVRPSGDEHLPATTFLATENTHSAAGGTVQPESELRDLGAFARARGLAWHLDGARLWNAAIALGTEPGHLARHADTAMVSFSKGLGAPAGSCLALPRALRPRAVEIRRRLGGGMRQSGFLAAAAQYGLDHHYERLAEDHGHARILADRLAGHPACSVIAPETNIVMIDLLESLAEPAAAALLDAGVLVSVFGPRRLRAVTHLGLAASDVARAADTIGDVLGSPVAARTAGP